MSVPCISHSHGSCGFLRAQGTDTPVKPEKRLDFTLGLPEMRTRWYPASMTVTLAQIHEDPAILDRAIASQETLEIVSCGELAATLMPRRVSALEQARQEMARRFAAPDWSFTVGIPLTREERNARS